MLVFLVQRILSVLLTSMSNEQHHTFFGLCFSCAVLPTSPSVFRDLPGAAPRVVVAFVGNQFMVDPLEPVSLLVTRRKISCCPQIQEQFASCEIPSACRPLFFCDLHEVSEHVLGHVLLMCGDTRLPFCFSSRDDPSSSKCWDHSYRARERMKSTVFGVSRSMHTLLLCVTLAFSIRVCYLHIL